MPVLCPLAALPAAALALAAAAAAAASIAAAFSAAASPGGGPSIERRRSAAAAYGFIVSTAVPLCAVPPTSLSDIRTGGSGVDRAVNSCMWSSNLAPPSLCFRVAMTAIAAAPIAAAKTSAAMPTRTSTIASVLCFLRSAARSSA